MILTSIIFLEQLNQTDEVLPNQQPLTITLSDAFALL
jgi:hypothetical protein